MRRPRGTRAAYQRGAKGSVEKIATWIFCSDEDPAPFTAVALTSLLLTAVALGCGGGGETSSPTASTGASGTESTSSAGGAGGAGTGAGGDGQGGGIILVDAGNDAPVDLCAGAQCPADQHCNAADGLCVNSTCADLTCSATEVCATTPGGGAICKDISCTSDASCPISQFCNGTICVDDLCPPGQATCVGEELHECKPNGGGDAVKYVCGSQSYFPSTCTTPPGQGDASCPCEGDWDCPLHTSCEAGACIGSGKAPTCTLPPQPFQSVLPTPEIHWGGVNQASKDAVAAPSRPRRRPAWRRWSSTSTTTTATGGSTSSTSPRSSS